MVGFIIEGLDVIDTWAAAELESFIDEQEKEYITPFKKPTNALDKEGEDVLGAT